MRLTLSYCAEILREGCGQAAVTTASVLRTAQRLGWPLVNGRINAQDFWTSDVREFAKDVEA